MKTKIETLIARDQAWLEQIFLNIVKEHFFDINSHNPVRIEWGRKARTRLGSLGYDSTNREAVIRITKLFADPNVPALVVKATIVHELCHYAHGWFNGNKPKYRHPHQGGVIKAEFAERGLEELYIAQQKWLKTRWLAVVQKYYPKFA